MFSTKIILGALTLDMFAVLFGGAVASLPVFAQDILKVGPEGFGVLRASIAATCTALNTPLSMFVFIVPSALIIFSFPIAKEVGQINFEN